MSLPFSGTADIGGYSILPSEINFVTALASSGSDVSDTFNVQGGSLYVVAQMASGQATLSAKLSTTTPIADPASGGTSVTLINTSKSFIKLDADTSNIYAALKLVDANWSSALGSLDIFVLYQKSASRDFFWYSTDNDENGGGNVVSSLPR